MTGYRIHAIPQATADEARARLVSPHYGHAAESEVAGGYGPCRLCLDFFEVGRERRLLFTYDPFAETGAPPLPGPIYVHEAPCERYPEDGGFPEHLLAHPLTLSAYGPDRRLLAEERVEDGAIEPVLERLLGLGGAEYVHVRDTRAGCFDLRVAAGVRGAGECTLAGP